MEDQIGEPLAGQASLDNLFRSASDVLSLAVASLPMCNDAAENKGEVSVFLERAVPEFNSRPHGLFGLSLNEVLAGKSQTNISFSNRSR